MAKQGTTLGHIYPTSLFNGPAPCITSAAPGRNMKMVITEVSQFSTLLIHTTANMCL